MSVPGLSVCKSLADSRFRDGSRAARQGSAGRGVEFDVMATGRATGRKPRFRDASHLAVAAALVLAVEGCTRDREVPAGPAAPTDSVARSVGADGRRVFDPARLRVGDHVLGLRVVAADISLSLDSTHVGDVRFAGRIRLRGTPVRHPDHPAVDLLCFDVDSSSVNALPRWPLDQRRVWFCFENRDEATRRLGPPRLGRQVTIEIDDYQTVRHETDAFDTARLIRVIRKP